MDDGAVCARSKPCVFFSSSPPLSFHSGSGSVMRKLNKVIRCGWKMLVEFRDAIRRFDNTCAEVQSFLAERRSNNFSENFRFSVSAGDTAGSLHSLFSAYKAVLPWRFEEYAQHLTQRLATPIIPPEVVLKIVKGIDLSDEERICFEEWQRVSGEVVAGMISRSELKDLSGASAESATAEQQFVTSFKAFVFFLRSLQDAIYGCLLISTNLSPAAKPDMKRILDSVGEPKFDHQVAQRLAAVENYFEWFGSFKALRNRIKGGTAFGQTGTPPDIGIVLSNMQKDGALVTNVNDQIMISDVIRWVQINCNAMQQILL